MNINTFTKKYKLSKTLRFELRPVGRTSETFREKFFANDSNRSSKYPLVKILLDAQHKALLERALSAVEIDWIELADAANVYRDSDRSKEAKSIYENVQAKFREAIAESLKKDDLFKPLTASTPTDLFKEFKKQYKESQEDVPAELETFFKFSCYFKGYQENRKNIYSSEHQATSAANRAVNENFPKFLDNIRVFNHILENYPDIVSEAENEIKSILGDMTLSDIFDVGAYNKYLPQSGIDFYNQVIGGYVPQDGEKIRGINEFINLYRQKNDEARSDRQLTKMSPLFKQILSDRETLSVIPQAFKNDAEVLSTIKKVIEEHLTEIDSSVGKYNLIDSLELLLKITDFNSGIWISGADITYISKNFLGEWNLLPELLENYAEQKFANERTDKRRKDAVDRWMKSDEFSLSEIDGNLTRHTDDGTEEIHIAEFWQGSFLNDRIQKVKESLASIENDLTVPASEDNPLREQKDVVNRIKNALDSILELLHYIKPLNAGVGLNRNENFYSEFNELYSHLDAFVPLYNKVRSYITKKPSETERIKLMFDNPTLADGWDQNKEDSNKCVIFMRDGLYYLGIMSPSSKIDFTKLVSKESGDCYKKMVYKLLPGPNKMLPHVFFSTKGIATYKPSKVLLEKYGKGLYKKGAAFDLSFCHELIDFFKASIEKHPDWSNFGFKFSDTKTYKGIDEFYREISEQGYKLTYDNIPLETINKLVDEGKLNLFKIWCKDFSKASTGRPNLHTQYWNAVFNPENLDDVVIKLNGEAEIFFRPNSIKEPFSHKVGEKMVNRRDSDGAPIPETIHGELFRHFNGCRNNLSEEATKWLNSGKLVIKDVKHEIVKDARYTEDKFAFHVPITINFKEQETPSKFNDQVLEFLKDNPDVKIIGIDRGERHLLYLTLIDQKGNIIEQRSFNTITGQRVDGVNVEVDYQSKLVQAEKDRDEARKSWSEIGAIKDLKEGYLSAVVFQIAKMMVEHNAIVVLEDLNVGFKRGRFRIERQVYQKFEKALIDKLNYLVFKSRGLQEPGGILNGYQLTDKFVSFERIGKQTGFLFYVPAGYTSKIDPTTGFTNLFNTKSCTNAEGIKNFFMAFDDIKWDSKRKAFAFAFDYSNFKVSKESYQKSWTVYSSSRRLVYDKDAKGFKEFNPTDEILAQLGKQGQNVTSGFDLKSYIGSLEPSKTNASFFKSLFYAFDRTLQMRNSNKDEDYIQSPVLNDNDEFFDSRKASKSLPQDADANGAYHIALKGLLLIKEHLDKGSRDLKIEHSEWFKFAQELAKGK